MQENQRFAGKTVVLTGAAGNIGSAISRRFIEEGANLVAIGRNKLKLEQLANQLGERVEVILADATDRAQMQKAMEQAANKFGSIDVVVANAGTNVPAAFEESTDQIWDQLMDTNLRSFFITAQTALPYFSETGGSIVATSSINSLGGDRSNSVFNAAKAGINNLARGMALDLGQKKIRVNAVAPALTVPESLAAVEPVAGWVKKSEESQALPGHGTPDDVAAAIAFLASDDARFITGVVLPVDGGLSARSGLPEFF